MSLLFNFDDKAEAIKSEATFVSDAVNSDEFFVATDFVDRAFSYVFIRIELIYLCTIFVKKADVAKKHA